MSQEFINSVKNILIIGLSHAFLFFFLTPGSFFTIPKDKSCESSWFNIFKGNGGCVTNTAALFIHTLIFFLLTSLVTFAIYSKLRKNNRLLYFFLYIFILSLFFFLIYYLLALNILTLGPGNNK